MINRSCICLISSLMCTFLCTSQIVLAQAEKAYRIEADWATLPEAGWDGSTSWVAADGDGNILVMVRSAPYFRLFTRNGDFIKSFGEMPEMRNAHSVTFDSQGNIWATDAARHVVYKISPDEEILMTLGRLDETGDNTSPVLFNQANHVFVADNGDIYVSDGYQNSRVVQFNSAGEFMRIIGGEKGADAGQLDVPHGVALDSRGRILVNDSGNQRVAVFGPSGEYIESWVYPSRGGIVVTADDVVYISDVNAGVVNIIKEGVLLDSIKVDARPHGLAVDTDGAVYVSDARGRLLIKITKN